MGAISFSLDLDLLRAIKKQLPFSFFVETGTFRGETLERVASDFPRRISIELSQDYFERAQEKFSGQTDVELCCGDSSEVLRELQVRLEGESVFYWLDAHWCAAEGTAGERSQCPLLQELSAIGTLNSQCVIAIDDARLFLAPPPPPHEISTWPDFDAIIRQLQKLSSRHVIACWNDVILFVPDDCFQILRPFLSANGFNLLSVLDRSNGYDTMLQQAQDKEGMIADLKKSLEFNLEGWRTTESLLAELALSLEKSQNQVEEKEAVIVELKQAVDHHLAGWKAASTELKSLRLQLHDWQKSSASLNQGDSDTFRELVGELAQVRSEASTLRSSLDAKSAEAAKLAQKVNDREHTIERLTARQANGPRRLPWIEKLETSLNGFFQARTECALGTLSQYPPRRQSPESLPPVADRKTWPRMCIITPSYQQGPFLERTIRSVLDQNYPNLAYGVQDGGSTDGSAEIITKHIGRLSHAESCPDEGQADAIRRGFDKLYPLNDHIMAWLNSDDMLVPGALRYVADYFSKHPEVDIVYGHRLVIDEDDREIGRWYLPRYHRDTLKWFDLIPQETLFWRARCYKNVGGIDPSFQFALDWDLLARFAQAGFVIKRLPCFIGSFRVHTQQKTSAKINSVGNQEMDRIRRRIHGRDISQIEIERQFRNEIRRSMQVEYLHQHGIRF